MRRAELPRRPGVPRIKFDPDLIPQWIRAAIANPPLILAPGIFNDHSGLRGERNVGSQAKPGARDVFQGDKFGVFHTLIVFPLDLHQLGAEAAVFFAFEFHEDFIGNPFRMFMTGNREIADQD